MWIHNHFSWLIFGDIYFGFRRHGIVIVSLIQTSPEDCLQQKPCKNSLIETVDKPVVIKFVMYKPCLPPEHLKFVTVADLTQNRATFWMPSNTQNNARKRYIPPARLPNKTQVPLFSVQSIIQGLISRKFTDKIMGFSISKQYLT